MCAGCLMGKQRSEKIFIIRGCKLNMLSSIQESDAKLYITLKRRVNHHVDKRNTLQGAFYELQEGLEERQLAKAEILR